MTEDSNQHQPPRWATRLSTAVKKGVGRLIDLQKEDGHWCFELEADCTIPSEYILMMHYMDEIDEVLQSGMARYLRNRQMTEGGWPLYTGGDVDISCTVKAYYALKLAGDDPESAHMRRARQAVLQRGGAVRSNVFTRITLAMFEQLPWSGVPFIPVEVMLFPRWFFFHLDKVAYWSRTVMVPLFILCSLRARARNPCKVGVRELFTVPPEKERDWFPVRNRSGRLFLVLDQVGRRLEHMIPRWVRKRSVERAEAWIIERLNGEGGLGAIFPAMVNAYEALELLGYGPEHEYRVAARRALQKLVVVRGEEAYCQPCVSPVWDTGLAAHALLEAGVESHPQVLGRAFDWLKRKQLLASAGDWQVHAPTLSGGGWAFQYDNDYYPDLDDTALVAWGMDRHRKEAAGQDHDLAIDRAVEWLTGMQSSNGGFGAFDANNDHYYLNQLPFADHGALLDPPTADVSARVLGLLARVDGGEEDPRHRQVMTDCFAYLEQQQEDEGAWYGRWGTNYIYGTWSVLAALEQAKTDTQLPMVRKAVCWLKSVQRADGGWGEDNDSYLVRKPGQSCSSDNIGSTAFQTAWALLGLMAAGEGASEAVDRGIAYLLDKQEADGLWEDIWFTAPGFPRVFYLKYHGYSKYFPLWALARYQRFMEQEQRSADAA